MMVLLARGKNSFWKSFWKARFLTMDPCVCYPKSSKVDITMDFLILQTIYQEKWTYLDYGVTRSYLMVMSMFTGLPNCIWNKMYKANFLRDLLSGDLYLFKTSFVFAPGPMSLFNLLGNAHMGPLWENVLSKKIFESCPFLRLVTPSFRRGSPKCVLPLRLKITRSTVL